MLDLTTAGRKVLHSDPTLELEKVVGALNEDDRDALARALETILRQMSSGPR